MDTVYNAFVNYFGQSLDHAAEKAANKLLAEQKAKEKPCLNCGKIHIHNNSFCSAECCKTWRTNNKLKIKRYSNDN